MCIHIYQYVLVHSNSYTHVLAHKHRSTTGASSTATLTILSKLPNWRLATKPQTRLLSCKCVYVIQLCMPMCVFVYNFA